MKIKKLLALLLALCMLLPMATLYSSAAVSINQGLGALRNQWSRGKGPTASGYSIGYSYFSPVANGASKEKKYPLIVLLPGFGEGTYEGDELVSNQFAYWSGAERQEKSHNGGAYVLIARAPEWSLVFWDTCPVGSLKAALDDFINKNSANVDTDRIYVGGWSLGASGAIRMAAAYNNFFAGVFPMSPRYTISAGEAAKLKNMAVWLFGCTGDVYSIYGAYSGPSWSNLVNASVDKSRIRLTKCSSCPIGGAFINHNMWNIVINDFTSTSGYSGLSTTDGNGRGVSVDSMISWLTSQKLIKTGSCSCNCHSSNIFVKLVWTIQVFVYRLVGNSSRRTCACGASHW